jgi:hypothetical protein
LSFVLLNFNYGYLDQLLGKQGEVSVSFCYILYILSLSQGRKIRRVCCRHNNNQKEENNSSGFGTGGGGREGPRTNQWDLSYFSPGPNLNPSHGDYPAQKSFKMVKTLELR